MGKEVKITLPEELYEELERLQKSRNFKTMEDVIIYLIRLGLSVLLGVWIHSLGLKPEDIRKKVLPENLPEPHPYWPRII
ncbi:MAG: hypothetical protein J7K58_00615 [Euryarchaeota archaeon]|nr:hypothetical protein [Euryarchaeota archaeon]